MHGAARFCVRLVSGWSLKPGACSLACRLERWCGEYICVTFVYMSKQLVEIDDRLLAEAAAALGTRTKKDTITRALRLVVEKPDSGWDDWADGVGERVAKIDWGKAWR